MGAVLERLDDFAVVGLDATPQGRPVYEKLGFVEAGTFLRMGLEVGAAAGVGGRATPLAAGDLDEVLRRDRAGLRRRPCGRAPLGLRAGASLVPAGRGRDQRLQLRASGRPLVPRRPGGGPGGRRRPRPGHVGLGRRHRPRHRGCQHVRRRLDGVPARAGLPRAASALPHVPTRRPPAGPSRAGVRHLRPRVRLAARGGSPASHRGGRGARLARRDDRAYRGYVREEQRGQAGCIARRMQPDFHHGLLAQLAQRPRTSGCLGSRRSDSRKAAAAPARVAEGEPREAEAVEGHASSAARRPAPARSRAPPPPGGRRRRARRRGRAAPRAFCGLALHRLAEERDRLVGARRRASAARPASSCAPGVRGVDLEDAAVARGRRVRRAPRGARGRPGRAAPRCGRGRGRARARRPPRPPRCCFSLMWTSASESQGCAKLRVLARGSLAAPAAASAQAPGEAQVVAEHDAVLGAELRPPSPGARSSAMAAVVAPGGRVGHGARAPRHEQARDPRPAPRSARGSPAAGSVRAADIAAVEARHQARRRPWDRAGRRRASAWRAPAAEIAERAQPLRGLRVHARRPPPARGRDSAACELAPQLLRLRAALRATRLVVSRGVGLRGRRARAAAPRSA